MISLSVVHTEESHLNGLLVLHFDGASCASELAEQRRGVTDERANERVDDCHKPSLPFSLTSQQQFKII